MADENKTDKSVFLDDMVVEPSCDGVNRHQMVDEADLRELGYKPTKKLYKGMKIWENDYHGLLLHDFMDGKPYVYLKYNLPKKR